MTLFLRVLREPLLHFLLLGALIFAVFWAMADEAAPEADERTVVVPPEIASQLAARFRETWRRSPSADELNALIDGYVNEEILVREAQTLSMEAGDTIIRRRLAQKMQFLLTSAAGASIVPEEDALRAYFDENKGQYTAEARVTFEQVFLGEAVQAEQSEAALAALRSGADPGEVAQSSLLPPAIRAGTRNSIDGVFGTGFFAELAEQEAGDWRGPVRSAFGIHAVRIVDFSADRAPPFETVRDRVEADWKEAQIKTATDAMMDDIRSRYTVTRPSGDDIEGILK